ncbi:flagellar hook-associated protein 3 [Clostridium homopropionicum DSM 5847]|uniref:Flagellar hook-associated protein 3 n=1 Tax=Clostridium homopropionicum DSM 5847 TaxID=1121318 RepID=A0A0L6ZDJ1_9CLOT|nr:flagellar hook-associated protein FlgL [Clostridium homopropionicum]KOA21049.1 flagellar hook-associated protein 3 [Clostridium homopropionicum DSM 5847]SFF98529.1 flagellar hook-associated protein 3 FlgL [Clostridium homopropionicum]
MRITNKMLSNTFLSDMRTNLENMKKMQQQMTSGKEIRKPSDDPFKAARSMQLHTDINTNKQYNENISDTINWLDTTDTALGQVGDVLQRVRELLIGSGNAAYSENERTAIKDEINEKIGEIAQILNTNFDGAYIFGGSRGTTKPVDAIGGVDYKNASRIQGPIGKNSKIEFVYNSTTYTVLISDSNSGSITSIANEINNKIATDATLADIKDKIKVMPNLSEGSLMMITNEEGITSKLTTDIYSQTIAADGTGLNIGDTTKNKSIQIGNIKIAISKDENDLDTVVSKIEKEIQGSEELKGRIKVEKDGTNFKFTAIDNTLSIKIDNDTSDNTNSIIEESFTTTSTVEEDVTLNKVSMSNIQNTQLVYYKKSGGFLDNISDPNSADSLQYNQIGTKLKVQISQGVIMDYNVTATEILEFKNNSGKELDLKEIFNSITNHLDGKDSSGTTIDNDAVKNLLKDDLQNITDTISNLLKIRSEVGAKQNRMDSAKEKNEDSNFNMTEILSKNEDIDITEKTMEFAVMQTVYIASLQTSAKVIQPSLLDYLG